MPVTGAMVLGGSQLLGGLLGSSSAKKAAQASANAQIKAAQIAADAARFRPVGITSRFGTSNFQFDPKGNLTSAGYDVAPDVAMLRDRLLSQAGMGGLQTADQAMAAQQQLMNLGQGYLAQSPQEAAQNWLANRQALLAPGREQAWAQLSQGDYNRGTTGLKVAQGGGLLSANPYATALANAQSKEDLALAAEADKEGRAQATFGAGLFGTGLDIGSQGYNPLKTQFGLAQSFEQAGQSPLDIGAQLGGRSAQAGANVGQSLFAGGSNAAKTLQAANSMNPWADALSGLGRNPAFGQAVANWWNSPTPSTGGNPLPTVAPSWSTGGDWTQGGTWAP